ncbi:MAG: DUF1116 domain-containing protein, partial [Clostridia bacterium]|nr:DUF1116 domain-containing protein [Clostridia bacterium]
MDLIDFNPADKVDRPKKGKYLADYYNVEEIGKLFEVTKDHYLGLLIRMTAFYGFRRSEVLGLKWNCVDFENDKITVRHIVTQTEVDGKLSLVEADRAKTDSSLRSLPLVSGFKKELLKLKEVQKENKKICGNCYNTEFEGYIFVDQMGNENHTRQTAADYIFQHLIVPKLAEMDVPEFPRRQVLDAIRFHTDPPKVFCFRGTFY